MGEARPPVWVNREGRSWGGQSRDTTQARPWVTGQRAPQSLGGSAPLPPQKGGEWGGGSCGRGPAPPSQPLRFEASGFWPSQHFCLRLLIPGRFAFLCPPPPACSGFAPSPCAPFHLLPSTPSVPICLINTPSSHLCPSPSIFPSPSLSPPLNQYSLPPSLCPSP